jgi:hypothetical protein
MMKSLSQSRALRIGSGTTKYTILGEIDNQESSGFKGSPGVASLYLRKTFFDLHGTLREVILAETTRKISNAILARLFASGITAHVAGMSLWLMSRFYGHCYISFFKATLSFLSISSPNIAKSRLGLAIGLIWKI